MFYCNLFIIPLGFLSVEFIFQLCHLFLKLYQTVLAETVIFFLKGRFLNFHLHDLTAHFIQLCGHGIQLCLDQGTGFIYQVNGLIRQEPVGNITVRQSRCGHQRAVGDLYSMENLITFLQSTKNGNGVFHSRLIYHNRLEPTFQGSVFFNIFPILIQSGGTDAVKFSSCQHRFQHISGIHGTVSLTCPYDQMELINKQDDLSFAFLYFFQNGFQPFLKLASVFGPCYQGTHIQCKNLLIFQTVRHISLNDPLGQSLNGCCLTYSRFTDEHRVILGLPGQDTDHIPDLAVTADHRIQLLLSGLFHQILPVFIQSIIGYLRIIRSHPLISSHSAQGLKKSFLGDPIFLPDFFHRRTWVIQQSKEQMLYGNIFISHSFCLILCGYQRLVQILADIRLASGNLCPGI